MAIRIFLVPLVGYLLLGAALLPSRASAQDTPVPTTRSAGEAASSARAKPRNSARQQASRDQKMPGFTPQREAAALRFVDEHHAELSELLAQLKSSNRGGYQRAINELFRTSERLAASKQRDSTRYEFELRAWKLDSRIRLLAARLSMTENEALREELKSLLLEKADVRLAQKQWERDRLAARLAKLDAAIERARRQREAQAQQSLDVLLRNIQQSQSKGRAPRGNGGPANRPARKPSAKPGDSTPN